jgi:hypothetical protein
MCKQILHLGQLVPLRRAAAYLCFYSRMLYESSRVCREATVGTCNVGVDLSDLVNTSWLLCNERDQSALFSCGEVRVQKYVVVPTAVSWQVALTGEEASEHEHTNSLEVMRFSTAKTTPSVVHTPTAVDPSCRHL